MAKKKVKRWIVRLFGTLPCSTTMIVEAETEEEAREYADEHYAEADWDGADYGTPQGCDVEVVSARLPMNKEQRNG